MSSCGDPPEIEEDPEQHIAVQVKKPNSGREHNQ
jgi:hypothetical protein